MPDCRDAGRDRSRNGWRSPLPISRPTALPSAPGTRRSISPPPARTRAAAGLPIRSLSPPSSPIRPSSTGRARRPSADRDRGAPHGRRSARSAGSRPPRPMPRPGGEVIFIHVADASAGAARRLRRPFRRHHRPAADAARRRTRPPHPDPRHQGLARAADAAGLPRPACAEGPRPSAPSSRRSSGATPAALVMSARPPYITAAVEGRSMARSTGIVALAGAAVRPRRACYSRWSGCRASSPPISAPAASTSPASRRC